MYFKNNKIKQLFSILLLLVACVAYAQDDFELTNYEDNTIPPSPTSASLGSYAYAPISLVTGTPNISIPIHNLKGNSLSLPISMSYRPGVKLEDVSEYTGHGWSLFAGGVITRQKIGSEDPDARIRSYDNDPYSYEELLPVIATGSNKDSAPDLFNYNFNGFTGQFALKEDLQTPYYIKERRNWKFSFSLSRIEITVEDGTTYIFKDIGTTSVEEDEGTINHDFITSWYLSEIISSKTNERIEFTYYDESFYPTYVKNNKGRVEDGKVVHIYEDTTWPFAFETKRINDITLFVNDVATNKVVFEKDTDPREDISYTYALDKILIYAKATDALPIKYFDFTTSSENGERIYLNSIQEYSGDGTTSKPPYVFDYYEPWDLPARDSYKADFWGYYSANGAEFPYGLPASSDCYLATYKEASFPEAQYGSLKSMTFPTGGKNEYTYELNEYYDPDYEYYTTGEFGLDWDTDEWVFYTENVPTPSNSRTTTFNLPSDQEVKIDMNLWINKNLGYDYTVFRDEIEEYEIRIKKVSDNQEVFSAYFDGNGDPDEIDLIINSGIYEIFGQNDEFVYDYGTCLNDYELELTAGEYEISVKTSSIDNQMSGLSKAVIEVKYHSADKIIKNKKGAGIRIANQKLLDDDGTELRNINYNYYTNGANGNSTDKSSGQLTEKIVTGYDIPFVKYYYEVFICPPDEECYCKWESESSHLNELIARTGTIGKTGVTPCSYEAMTGLKESIVFSKSPSASNSWVMYTEVKETETGNGFKITRFNGLEYGDEYHLNVVQVNDEPYFYWNPVGPFPQIGKINYSEYGFPGNGNLIINGLWDKPIETLIYSDGDYKNGTSGPVLLKEENYEYYRIEQPKLWSIVADGMLATIVYGISYFPNKIGYLKSKTTKTYDDTAPESYVLTKSDYEYYGQTGQLPDKITTTDSNGNKTIKKIKYTLQYGTDVSAGNNSSLTMQDLRDHNILGPIEEQLWRKDNAGNYKLIGGKLNSIDDVSAPGSNNPLFQPIEVLSLEIGQQNSNTIVNEFNTNSSFSRTDWYNDETGLEYEEQGVDLKYDEDGNLIEINQKNGTTTAYIWGYDKQYPIAKIENATKSQIDALPGFGVDFNTGNTALTAAQESTLRDGLPDAMVTTFTYNPLIGLTSMTDPRGFTIHYEYDKLNMLKSVKDADGNLVKEHEYNYKNN